MEDVDSKVDLGPALMTITPQATHADVSAAYQSAQRKCPVHQLQMPDGGKFWAVIGEPELDSVLKNHAQFSSEIYHFGDQPAIPIEMDPPLHTEFRQLLNKFINPASSKLLESDIRRYVIEALVPFVAAGGGDIAPLARALPMRVLCRLMGMPDDEAAELARTQAQLAPADMVATGEEAAKARFAGLIPVLEHGRKLIAARRAKPEADLVSGLLEGVIQGRPITDDEVLQMLKLVLLAGHETTGGAIAGATLLLAQHPESQSKLRADTEAIPRAVEECLRVENPVQTLDRKVVADIELGGASMKAGDVVMTMYGAANFDERKVKCPANFDIDRRPNQHLTFGRGIHACLGAPLARMEIRIFLEEILARTSSIKLRSLRRNRWPDLSPALLDVELIQR